MFHFVFKCRGVFFIKLLHFVLQIKKWKSEKEKCWTFFPYSPRAASCSGASRVRRNWLFTGFFSNFHFFPPSFFPILVRQLFGFPPPMFLTLFFMFNFDPFFSCLYFSSLKFFSPCFLTDNISSGLVANNIFYFSPSQTNSIEDKV